MALDRMRSVKAVWYLTTAPFSAPLDFKLRSSFKFFSLFSCYDVHRCCAHFESPNGSYCIFP